jgi:MFS superfamily sulfate permease-like transporter
MTNAQEKGSGSKVRSLFPILKWLQNYNWNDIRYDLIAGIVVAGLTILATLLYPTSGPLKVRPETLSQLIVGM